MPDLIKLINSKRCPLCTGAVTTSTVYDGMSIECKTCGIYEFAESWLPSIKSDELELLPFLSIHTRHASERGERTKLDSRNWKEFALAHDDTPVAQKVMKLLELAGARSRPGMAAKFNLKEDAPLVWAVSGNEFNYLLEHLREIGYLDKSDGCIVTPKGWEQLQSVTVKGTPGRCFVAMSFDDSLKEAYDKGIYLAIKIDRNMDPVMLARVQHNEKICDKIVAEIRSCQFLIADVTLCSANVYFEAGFAMALGRPVIWSCRHENFDDDVRFDTRQYPYIRWKSSEDLRQQLDQQLADRIKATIPGAV